MVEGDQDAGATGRTDGAAGWGWGRLAAWAAIGSGLVGLAPAVLPPLVAVLAGFAAVRIRIGRPPDG